MQFLPVVSVELELSGRNSTKKQVLHIVVRSLILKISLKCVILWLLSCCYSHKKSSMLESDRSCINPASKLALPVLSSIRWDKVSDFQLLGIL